MKKIILMFSGLVALVSCEMDFYRSDTMTSSQLKDDPGAAVYTTDGNYALFKDILMYNGSEYSNNTYVRHYFQMTEFRGDNACLSGRTEDPLYEAMTYSDNSTLYNLSYFWYVAYKIIYGANSNIESIQEGVSVESDHMLGENYFMRAIVHLHLSNLYSRPYSRGRDNPGVVLRTSTDCSVTERSTVGKVYDQIVYDLKKAADLMKVGKRRGNAGYIGYDAARGLLTRVYLYMGMDDECIALADEMLGSDPSSHLDTDLDNYFANARDSKETLWCVGKIATDPGYNGKSQIGSMYYDGNGAGWGEIYWSDPLVELYSRYPEDLRFKAYFSQLAPTEDGSKMVHWPLVDDKNDFRGNAVVHKVNFNDATGTWTFTYDGKSYEVKTRMVDGWPVRYIEGYTTDALDDDGVDGGTRVYVRDNVSAAAGVRQTYPKYLMSKFSGQDGDPMLSSPVMIRWAEVILNRAEAYAHKGNVAGALADVNVIRSRAGLSGDALMTEENWKGKGYGDILDVVLDERRLELCFEGHRAIDLYRNGKSIDRRFAGVQKWEILTPERLDEVYPYCIPYAEVTVSGIPNNK